VENLVAEAVLIILFVGIGIAGVWAFLNLYVNKAKGVSVPEAVRCSFTVSNTTNATYVYVESNVSFPIWLFVYVNASSRIYGPFNQTFVTIGNVTATRVVVQDAKGVSGICVYHP